MTDLGIMSARELAERTGKSVRYFQRLAATRAIDWALQPQGPGTAWMFRREGFENWIAGGKAKGTKWRDTSTGARARRSGKGGSGAAVANTHGPLKQRLAALLKNA